MCFSEHTPHVLLLLSKRVLFLKLLFNKCLESFTLMSRYYPYHHLGKLLVVLLVCVVCITGTPVGEFFHHVFFLFGCFVENIGIYNVVESNHYMQIKGYAPFIIF